MSESELIEQLADKEHASWARWMHYLFSKSTSLPDGSVVILAELVGRWKRQTYTPYERLSEQEKQSDRDEVAHILPIIEKYVMVSLPMGAQVIPREGNTMANINLYYGPDLVKCAIVDCPKKANDHNRIEAALDTVGIGWLPRVRVYLCDQHFEELKHLSSPLRRF